MRAARKSVAVFADEPEEIPGGDRGQIAPCSNLRFDAFSFCRRFMPM
jgi:hypothetical protein